MCSLSMFDTRRGCSLRGVLHYVRWPELKAPVRSWALASFIAVLQDGSVRMWGYKGFYQQGPGNNEEYPLRLTSPE